MFKFFVFAIVLNFSAVKCECDNFFSCFGETVHNLFIGDAENATKHEFFNKSNGTVVNFTYFEVDNINDDLNKNIKNFFVNLTEDFKGRAQETDKITAETDIFEKSIDNTDTLIKIFNLGDNYENFTVEYDEATNTTVLTNDLPIDFDDFFNNANTYFNFTNVTVALPETEKSIDKEDTNQWKEDLKNELNEIKFDFPDSYYDIDDDNSTDYPIIDYVDFYKDTTNEDVDYTPTEYSVATESLDEENNLVDGNLDEEKIQKKNSKLHDTTPNYSCHNNETNRQLADVIFPWIAAIFTKNGDSDQFEYICDGALISEKVILTAAQCLSSTNSTLEAFNLIVLTGKRSLQNSDGNEAFYRIKRFVIHENFTKTDGAAENDLAILEPEEPIAFSDSVQSACLINEDQDDVVASVTTGWQYTGELIPIAFNKQRGDGCEDTSATKFCSTYDKDAKTCPSFGGLYVVKEASNNWFLKGILSEDTSKRSICFGRNRNYTDLDKFRYWLNKFL